MSRNTATKRRGPDPRLERALAFLVPLLQGGALPFSDIRRASRRARIREQILCRAADVAGVVFITEAGKPLLWELSGLDPYGRPPRTYSESEEPAGASSQTDERDSEVSRSGREGSRSAVRTYHQSQTSRNPGNEPLVDAAIRRPASRSMGTAKDEAAHVGGQMVLWVNFAGFGDRSG